MSLNEMPTPNFDQDLNQDRPRFLYLPDGAKHPIRPNDPDGSGKLPSSKKSVVEIEFAELDDGRLIDLIEDPDSPGRTAFAIWENGDTKFVKELEYRGQLFVPKRIDTETLQLLKLPSGTRADQSAKQVGQLVGAFLIDCIDAPMKINMALVAFVLTTLIIDRVRVAPYLWIVGPPQSGKTTLLNALTLVCRRPLLVGDISSAAFYDCCDKLMPTLLTDEGNSQVGQSNPAFRQMLRIGSTRGSVARKNKFYSAYGAKVIVSPDLPEDPALMSGCIILPMEETKNFNLKVPSNPQKQRFAAELRKCLLHFRFLRYKLNIPTMIPGAEKLRPRECDLICSLVAPFLGNDDEKDWREILIPFLENNGSKTRETLPLSHSLVLAALFNAIHVYGNSGDAPQSRSYGITVGGLSAIANRQAKFGGETIQLNPRRVGDVLESLGFNSRTRTNQGWTIWLGSSELDRIHESVRRYGSFPFNDEQYPMFKRSGRFCRGTDSTQQTGTEGNRVAPTSQEASESIASKYPRYSCGW